ncbi:MAG: hypothetical protein MMC23_004866 [Stictis urceolatum]|nr:hypothetical protein [Stictis urceolata]
MASNSTNVTLPCHSFTALTDFLGAIREGNLNITKQIEECPDLCGLTWGSGNPDLSGIGASISWIYQTVLVFMFGPLFPSILAFAPRILRRPLKELHKQFFYAVALVVLPVLIAAIAYLRQGVALYEVTYIYYLATMQFLSLLGVSLSGAALLNQLPKDARFEERGSFSLHVSKLQAVLDKDPNKDRTSNQQRTQDTNIDVPRFVSWLEYAIAIALACIVAFGLYLGCLAWVHKSTVSLADNKALISACRSYSSIAPHVPAQPSRPTLPPSLYNTLEKLVGTKIATFIQTAVPLIIIVGVVIALVKGIGFVLSFSKILIYASIDPRINTVISLAFTIGVLYCLFRMQQERYMIQELSGADFEDNQWGFGQILTVFIWVPLSLNLLRWAAMLLLHKMKPGVLNSLDPENPSYLLNDMLGAGYQATSTPARTSQPQVLPSQPDTSMPSLPTAPTRPYSRFTSSD